jgi:hypothetical protein
MAAPLLRGHTAMDRSELVQILFGARSTAMDVARVDSPTPARFVEATYIEIGTWR